MGSVIFPSPYLRSDLYLVALPSFHIRPLSRSIVYSLKTMERDMKNDQHLRETVSDIIKNVKA